MVIRARLWGRRRQDEMARSVAWLKCNGCLLSDRNERFACNLFWRYTYYGAERNVTTRYLQAAKERGRITRSSIMSVAIPKILILISFFIEIAISNIHLKFKCNLNLQCVLLNFKFIPPLLLNNSNKSSLRRAIVLRVKFENCANNSKQKKKGVQVSLKR